MIAMCYKNNDRQKKEIEAKWQRLIAEDNTISPPKTGNIPVGAKVIRRRKGIKDTPGSSDRE